MRGSSPDGEVAALFATIVEDEPRRGEAVRERERATLRGESERLEAKRFALGELPQDAYLRLRTRYDADPSALAERASVRDDDADALAFAASFAAHLATHWTHLDGIGRQAMLGPMRPSRLTFDGVSFGTSTLSPLVALFMGRRAFATEARPYERGGLPAGLPG